MERLTQRDLRALLQCLRDLYAQLDLEGFTTRLLSALPRVVPAEIISYNEINPKSEGFRAITAQVPAEIISYNELNPPRQQDTLLVWEPADLLTPEHRRIFAQYMHEHPLINHCQQTRDGRAIKISDLLPPSQYHRLALYHEFFRRLGVEDQMVICLPSPPPLMVGIAFNRTRPDFRERERLLLNLLRPHLVQAYHNAEALTQMEQELARLRQVEEASDRGVILLTREGRVRWMTGRARRQLADYFGRLPRSAHRLPEPLERWVQEQRALLAQEAEVPPPREPLVVEREGRRLVVRLVAGRPEEPPLLLLEEEPTAFSAASLESLGLSRREAEVLFWVAQGKTNPEVALILGVSPRTVQTHLERVYQKLGVETRMAATLQALEALKLLRR